MLEQHGLGTRGDQVSMPGDRHLRLDQEEVSFGGPIDLLLLDTAVAAVPLGDLLGDTDRGEHHPVGEGLGFPACGLSKRAGEVASEGDAFLPDFKVAEGGCHGREYRGGIGWPRHRFYG